MAEPSPTEDPLDEAFAAYLRSCDAGELASREEFLAQFPELADQLKELMEAADMIGRDQERCRYQRCGVPRRRYDRLADGRRGRLRR